MISKALDAVSDAEKKAEQVIESANIEAEQIILEAEVKGRERLAAIEKSYKGQRLDKKEEAERQGKETVIQKGESTKQIVSDIEKTANKNMDSAVATILERVVSN